MSDTCIVFYHSSAWDGIPGRQRHFMEAISRYVPVIYIEEAHDRKWRVTYRQVGDNVTLVRGLASVLVKFERRKWKLASQLWCRWHLGWIRRKYRRVIFWDAENWLRPFRFIPHDLLVFDCIDPCFGNDPADVDLYVQRERELLAAADFVFATADALAERCRLHHDDVTLINNACAPQEYTAAKIAAAPRPPWWPATGKPVAAYLGSLDWRIDFRAMLAACRLNPNVHFVLAGYLLAELESAAAELRAMPNATLTGHISVDEGRYLLAHCSAGLIPFTMGAINDAINPVKLYAYALLGKPVAGTKIRELESRAQFARTGGTPEEFAARVGRAIAESCDEDVRKSLVAFAMENTWDHRARQALSKLMPDLCLSPSPLYSGERVGVRGQEASCAARSMTLHPQSAAGALTGGNAVLRTAGEGTGGTVDPSDVLPRESDRPFRSFPA